MEFRDSVNVSKTWSHKSDNDVEKEKKQSKWRKMMTMSRRTRISEEKPIPQEFLCPISNTLMAQPVIVSSGHTFDRTAVVLCTSLSFTPTLPDGTTPDFSTLIPNLALRSAILNFCAASSIRLPTPHHIESAVLAFIYAQRPSSPSPSPSPSSPACLLTHHSSSDEDGNDIVAKLRSQRAGMVEKGVRALRKTTRSSEASRILL